jgi:metal transporter CNNM
LGTQLLCSLLLGNVCVNSAISILLDNFTTGYVALAVSSLVIVIFGEMIPQAMFHKKALTIGAKTIWITRFFIGLTFPVSVYYFSIQSNLFFSVGLSDEQGTRLHFWG